MWINWRVGGLKTTVKAEIQSLCIKMYYLIELSVSYSSFQEKNLLTWMILHEFSSGLIFILFWFCALFIVNKLNRVSDWAWGCPETSVFAASDSSNYVLNVKIRAHLLFVVFMFPFCYLTSMHFCIVENLVFKICFHPMKCEMWFSSVRLLLMYLALKSPPSIAILLQMYWLHLSTGFMK